MVILWLPLDVYKVYFDKLQHFSCVHCCWTDLIWICNCFFYMLAWLKLEGAYPIDWNKKFSYTIFCIGKYCIGEYFAYTICCKNRSNMRCPTKGWRVFLRYNRLCPRDVYKIIIIIIWKHIFFPKLPFIFQLNTTIIIKPHLDLRQQKQAAPGYFQLIRQFLLL